MDSSTSVTHLRCEYLVNPLGIDETVPRLNWRMESDRRGARQEAWRVLVASSPDLLDTGVADLWDSGRVAGKQSTQIEYAGQPLGSRQACYWQVTVWDENGDASRSEIAYWTMGLLQSDDWQARWITHNPEIIRRDPEAREATATEPGTVPLLRKAFDLPARIRRGTLYCTARGLADIELNGRAISPDRFLPEWTDYNRRLHYRTYDVTRLLLAGENVLGVMLGDGWWSGFIGWQETRGQYGTLQNSLLVQLEVELDGGDTVVVTSDGTWRCETGPILSSDFMMGEVYDARRERPGWSRPAFDDSGWLTAVEVAPPVVHVPQYGFSNNQSGDTTQLLPLVAQRSEPVRVVGTIRPVSVHEVGPSKFVYDLGQNIAGWVCLAVQGPAGTKVTLRHAERLNPDGTIYTENLRRALAADTYVLKGSGEEVWQPRFTFHGFQYLELSGLPEPVSLDNLCGCVVMSSTSPTGEFECSHPLVNRLWQNALWGQKGNFLSVPTDCPQRDERLGWMGDAQVFLRSATYNMDVAAFFTKWMTDVADSQDCDGIFPDIAPRLREGDNFIGLDGLGGAAGWADAGITVPWTMWQVYGDLRIIERHWEVMVRWIDWLERSNPDGIRCEQLGNNYGDWLCIPSDTTFRTHSEMKTLLATAHWADDAAKMGQMARALGRLSEAEWFEAMFERVRTAFQSRWLLDDGRLAVDTQTAYLLALAFDLLPQELRHRAAAHLVENIQNLDWHLSTGFIGIRHLNPQLTVAGYADVAYRLLSNEDYPSWLYPVLHGATTIWERWNGWTEADGFFNPQMNSFNHYSLGSVSEWLYRHVAGIELDPSAPGFQQFVIKPFIGGGLHYAGASYRTMFGTVESRWETTERGLQLRVRIPANTQVKVHVPCPAGSTITESGQPLSDSKGLNFLGYEDGFTLLSVGAGAYEFLVSAGNPAV